MSRTRYHFCYCVMLLGMAMRVVAGYFLPRDLFQLCSWVALLLVVAVWHFVRSVQEGVRSGDRL